MAFQEGTHVQQGLPVLGNGGGPLDGPASGAADGLGHAETPPFQDFPLQVLVGPVVFFLRFTHTQRVTMVATILKNMNKVVLLMMMTGLLGGCREEGPRPPVADVRPTELTAFGETRVDDYFWLREREDPDVIAYLEAENAYTGAVMRPTEALQEKLFAEMKGRIKKDDSSAPYTWNGYRYYRRFVSGGEYALHCRQPVGSDTEQVMLDGNQLNPGDGYFSLRGVKVSPDAKLVIFGTDTEGRRFYDLQIKNLETGEMLPDRIDNVTGNVAWAMDNRTFFYSRQDPETLRSHQIWRHRLGTPADQDVLVYEEEDDTFSVSVHRSKSDRYLFITSHQTLSSEWRLLEADNPEGEFRVFQPRVRDLEYDVEHQGDRFIILTNDQARNFRLMTCDLRRTGREYWRQILGHREDVYLEDVEVFRHWLVVMERFDGLSHLRAIPQAQGEDHILGFHDPTWTVWLDVNMDMDTTRLRYGYESMTTPDSIFEYDLLTREQKLLKQTEVLGGFEPQNYVSEYLQVPARDGALVPVSLVYRQGFERNGQSPLLLYGYGSYGYSLDADFDSSLLSLLDRGFVYAIAHVRGGEEKGRAWYEDGKLLRKKNTFTDFIDCARYLVAEGYTSSEGLFAEGGSAGGLLMGAVLNMAPDLWRGVVAQVPFVDVVTTMQDADIPLTTGEYDEWGNPGEEEYYRYMLSYSPYDNVTAQEYPALLVTTGLHDSQVQYWEPAKWVAKMRALKKGDAPLLLKTNMEAGHGGASGRFRRLKETALSYAFMLDLAGIRE